MLSGGHTVQMETLCFQLANFLSGDATYVAYKSANKMGRAADMYPSGTGAKLLLRNMIMQACAPYAMSDTVLHTST